MKAAGPEGTYSVTFGIENLPAIFVALDLWQKWRDLLAQASLPVIELYYEEAAERLITRVGASADVFKVVRPFLSAAADQASLEFADETNRTTRMQLAAALEETREAVRSNVVEGDGIAALTEKINTIFEDAETWRAKRIATTESSRAIHTAQVMSATASGNVARLKLLLSADACDVCVAIAEANPDGVPPGTPFATGMSANPNYSTIYCTPIHVNCQCTMTEVMTEDEAPGIRLDDLDALASLWGLDVPAAGVILEPEKCLHLSTSISVPTLLLGG
jgi:hypothetical protein